MRISPLNVSIIFVLFYTLSSIKVLAQAEAGKVTQDLPNNKTLTVTYNLSINGMKKTGIEEVYNGGNKTIFISNNLMRVRLVSLMRIQSIYFTIMPDSLKNKVTIVKESGKDKYSNRVSWSDWEILNSKYDSSHCDFSNDTLTVLDMLCKKANIKLKDGREITAYYTNKFYNPLLKQADPAFSAIPGIVLQYQYKRKGKSITYTASKILINNIIKSIFLVPVKNFAQKNFSNNTQQPPNIL